MNMSGAAAECERVPTRELRACMGVDVVRHGVLLEGDATPATHAAGDKLRACTGV